MDNGAWNPKGGHHKSGYWLPKEWQNNGADPAVVDSWRPGMALCAVMGRGLDLVDIDPHNGADPAALNGTMPTTYGDALTPSGGVHRFVKTLGIRSRDHVLPGIDVKAGAPEPDARGSYGRGFAFIAPTVKLSKVTGEPVAYRWASAPDLDRLAAERDTDTSGAALRQFVEQTRAGADRGTGTGKAASHDWPTTVAEFMRQAPSYDWPDPGDVPPGEQNSDLFRAACSLRGRGGVSDDEALVQLCARVDAYELGEPGWPWIHGDAERVWERVKTYPDGREQPGVEASSSSGGRPPLDVTYEAVTADWLRINLGAGPLAGTFNRGGRIVYTPRIGEDGYVPLTKGDEDGPAQVRTVKPGHLVARVQWTYHCYRQVKTGPRPAMFPTKAAQVAVDAPDMCPNLRPLRGVTHTPIVRDDGTILTEPGYDEATGMLYLPDNDLVVPAVPEQPSRADVAAAVALLGRMFGDFPFVTDHDRANYYATLLSPLLRRLAPPPYKLGVVNAKMRGSGKTLLCTLLTMIHGGVTRAEFPEDAAELRKQLSTILDTTTAPVVLLADNLTGKLQSSVLAGLLTLRHWNDRKLGGMDEMVSRPNDRMWVVNGNNVTIGGDMARRALWSTIDPKIPRPESRTRFAIPNLEAWTAEHRGEVLAALLTLIRSWVAAGRPVGPVIGSDNFAEWIRCTGGILAHAGIAGTVDNPGIAPEGADEDDDEWGTFLAAVHKVYGDQAWTAAEMLAKVNTWPAETAPAIGRPIPLDALPTQLIQRVDQAHGSTARLGKTLGMWMRNREGRWAEHAGVQYVARKAFKNRDGTQHWRIAVETAGSAGSAGSDLVPSARKNESLLEERPEQDPADPAPSAGEPVVAPGPSAAVPQLPVAPPPAGLTQVQRQALSAHTEATP